MTPSCHFCHAPVNPATAYRRVMAWERKGQGASRRGGSDIALREPLDVFACGTCVDRARRGVLGQGELVA